MNTNLERVIHLDWPHKSQLRDGSAELSPAGPASSTSCSLRCSHDPHLAAQRSTPTHNVGKVAAGTVFRKMVFEEAPAPPRPFLA